MSGQKTREMNQNIQKKIFFFGEIDFISIHVFSKLNFLKDSDLLWEETKSVTKIYIFFQHQLGPWFDKTFGG